MKAELYDGTTLEFPDGTPPETIRMVVKRETAKKRMGSIKQTVSQFARPILEGGGAAAGGILASPTGPIGAVAGGALGYGMGSQAANLLDEAMGLRTPPTLPNLARETAGNLATGAAFEAGGAALPVVVGGVARGIRGAGGVAKESYKNIMGIPENLAANRLAASTATGEASLERSAANLARAKELEAAIPGLKFTRGQATLDPIAMSGERMLVSKGGPVSEINLGQQATNAEALRSKLAEVAGKGGAIDDLLAALRARQEQSQGAVQTAKDFLEQRMSGVTGVDTQALGGRMRETLGSAKQTAKVKASAPFEELSKSGAQIDARPFAKKLEDIMKPLNKFEVVRQDSFPGVLSDAIETIKNSNGAMLPNDLLGLKSAVGAELRMARSASPANEFAVRRLTMAQEAIDNLLSNPSAVRGNLGEKVREAARGYREGYIEPFKQKAVGEVLRRDATGAMKIVDSSVPVQFWKNPEAADQLIKAVGPEEARGAMQAYAQQDLLHSIGPGEPNAKKLTGWLIKNKPVLDKYGIYREFSNIERAAKAVDDASASHGEWLKSAASRALGVDSKVAVSQVLSGKNKAAAMDELLSVVGNDTAAIGGIKRQLIDPLVEGAQTTARTQGDDAVISAAKFSRILGEYMPAIERLYANEPEKITALVNVNDALGRLAQFNRPLTSGSDTFEKTYKAFGAVAGPMVTTSYKFANAIRVLVDFLGKSKNAEVEQYLARAMFDPDYASTLFKLADNPISIKTKPIQMELKQQMASMGLISSTANVRKDLREGER